MRLLRFFQCFTLIFLCIFLQAGQTQQDDEYLLSENIYQSLLDIHELMEEENYIRAEEKLKGLLAKDIKPYDRAVLNQTLGHVHYLQADYSRSLDAFTRALDSGALPPDVNLDLNFNVAQLHAQEGNFRKSIEYLERWFKNTESADARSHIFAATIYYQLNRYEDMLPHIRQAFSISDKHEAAWYEMLFVAYYELDRFDDAADILVDMLSEYPEKDSYWIQLANTYVRTGEYSKATAVYEIADKKNLLNSQETIQLARLYLDQEIPYKAATLLQEKIDNEEIEITADNLQLLATSWLLAKEVNNAIEVLNDLARISNNPETYLTIGQVYFDQGNWEEAIESLEQATAVSDTDKNARVNLLLGIAAYHKDRVALANRALNKAATNEKTREQANWWLDKLDKKTLNKTSS